MDDPHYFGYIMKLGRKRKENGRMVTGFYLFSNFVDVGGLKPGNHRQEDLAKFGYRRTSEM
jgi:hypothetical protein